MQSTNSCRWWRTSCGWLALFVLGSSLMVATQTLAQENPSASDARLIEALKSYIPHVMREHHTPGLNIALARRGKVIWEEGFGYSDLEKKTPMTEQTVMHSGSMGKTYTATAVMQLVEQGTIGLYDPINKYLKDFKVINPRGEREITFYDLLTHRSGLGGDAAGSEFAVPEPLGEYLKAIYARKGFPPYKGTAWPVWKAKVGEKFEYSNLGMATLGYLVQVTNPEHLSFSEYVQKHIMDPLGMKSSQFPPVQDAGHVRSEIFARLSRGYADFGGVQVPTPTVYFAEYPAGTVVTTPGDHIRLLLAYLNGGNYNGYQLLKPETVRQMLTPQVSFNAPENPQAQLGGNHLGLVWFLFNVGKPTHSFGHGGAHMFGWTNEFLAFPDQDFALVVATNHWPMNDTRYHETTLIVQFITKWLQSEKSNLHRIQPVHSWAWKTSYVIGLMMGDRLQGGLGIDNPLTPEAIEAMARGTRVAPEVDSNSLWDEDGFRVGVEDILQVERTPDAIRSFMESDRLKVAPEELEMLHRDVGGQGVILPWPVAVPPAND